MQEYSKKSVSDIIIERIIKDAEKLGTMPWQRPYSIYNSFNWVTKKSYRGINRLILPFGEYLTKNQINEYNREHNEDYRFIKGIMWYPIVYFKYDEKPCSKAEIEEIAAEKDQTGIEFEDSSDMGSDTVFITRHNGWNYYKREGKYFKGRNILKYYSVADRKFFVNSKGETLPSRIDTGEVEIVTSEPRDVLYNYLDRENIQVDYTTGIPCYIPAFDRIRLNKLSKSESHFFSTAFHECAHSTGHISRLNRSSLYNTDKESYAVDECIAEITSCLLCAETGIMDFTTSGTEVYENNLAYINYWKGKLKQWGKEFIYIVSQADKAFNYIMSATEEDWEEGIL